MGDQEDAQAATDHYNYVRSQTNDPATIADAKANMDRANARAGQSSGGSFEMPGAIKAVANTLNWLSGGTLSKKQK